MQAASSNNVKITMARDETEAQDKRTAVWKSACIFCFAPGALLILILLPMSFKTVEYYEYGLLRRSSTGKMSLGEGVYDTGRYFVGPDYNFKYFQADGHYVQYHNLSVFSADRLECLLAVDIVYYINRSELVKLHNTYERQYRPVVDGRVLDAIKNTAPQFTTVKFFTEREKVQAALFEAVKQRLREVFCDLEQMYLLLVTIPNNVYQRQLKTAVQLENNIREQYISNAVQIRQQTVKMVNDINNNATLIQQRSFANANITMAKASAQARQIVELAQRSGLAYMYEQLNVTTVEHKSSLDYIRMLRTNPAASINVGYATKIATFNQASATPAAP